MIASLISFLFVCLIIGTVAGLISGWNAPAPNKCSNCSKALGPQWKVCPDCSTPVEPKGQVASDPFYVPIPKPVPGGTDSPRGQNGQALPGIARVLRRIAERLDPAGAPKQASPYTFTFEQRQGITLREDGQGCPIWYYGDADYAKAHVDAR